MPTKPDLLGRHTADQSGNSVFGQMIGPGLEVLVALAGVVFEGAENAAGQGLLLLDGAGASHQVDFTIAVTAQGIGIAHGETQAKECRQTLHENGDG